MTETQLARAAGGATRSHELWHVNRGAAEVAGKVVDLGDGRSEISTDALDIDTLFWPASEPGPAFHLATANIIDFLAATGDALREDRGGYLTRAIDGVVLTGSLSERILRNTYDELWRLFQPDLLRFQVEQELGGPEVLDGWKRVQRPGDTTAEIRAFPLRLIHVLPGNAPIPAATSIIRGSLTKGVHLLKMAANDPFTASAILRTMAGIDPNHPIVKSFISVYWRGGTATLENALFRVQFFDKIAAWGGQNSLRNIQRYIAPGFELVSFDPKNSISVVGRECFESAERLAEAVAAAATDTTLFNQEACSASRFHFVEGSPAQLERYCAALADQLGVERPKSDAAGRPVPSELRDEIEAARIADDGLRVWGGYDGGGLVLLTAEPVRFFPEGKTVNVVGVKSIKDAARYVSVATQTVGVYPGERRAEVRDVFAVAGVQRVARLGQIDERNVGLPHDGFYPLQRLVRWVRDA